MLPVVCAVTLALFTELADKPSDFASTANGLVFMLSTGKITIETNSVTAIPVLL